MIKSRKIFQTIRTTYMNEKGSALITVLIILLIFAVIGSAILITTTNNLYVAKRISEYEDIYYVAEANAQFALTFLKEEITKYYVKLQKIPSENKFEYEKAMEAFYPSIVDKIILNPNKVDAKDFVPLDFSDQGIETTVIFSVDVNTPLPNSDFGEQGNSVRFLIESVAVSDGSRRIVNAVLEVDDPDVDWHMTTAPPMTDMRMLIGNEIVLTDDLQNNEYNSIFCRGSALVAYAFVPQFLEDHQEFLDSFTYDFSNAVPNMLNWDLQYDKFPPHEAFDEFDSLFEASAFGTETYNSFYDWRYLTINYNIASYEPKVFDDKDILDGVTRKKLITEDDYYWEESYHPDTRDTTRYELGTADNRIYIYAEGDIYMTGRKNLKYCYIYAVGDIYININGYLEDCIIVSGGGNVYLNCNYIVNNGTHKLLRANGNLDIHLNVDAYMTRVVAQSKYGRITLNNDSPAVYDKIKMQSCYLQTNKYDKDAKIYLGNTFMNQCFISAGKDLILRNCSGLKSTFYAYGTTDQDLMTYGTSAMYTSRCYNDSMQYWCNGYFHRYYRGIQVISELSPKAGTYYQEENAFADCDFITDESIFLCDPYYSISGGNQIIDIRDSRIIADREVLLEDIIMDECYVFAGIRGYENEQEYYTVSGVPKLMVVRGINIRVDHTHNEIRDSVFYSRGRMMYNQHTPEDYGYPITEDGKVRVYSSLFYSIGNFEYNGISTSEGLDTTIMRNDSSLCNNMIIMTESNLGPHEYSPSVANDVLFIGGDLQLDPEQPHYSGTLFNLMGGPALRGIDDTIEVQCEKLYDNYFEQLLTPEEMIREAPEYATVFVYEDIYEKNEVGNGG